MARLGYRLLASAASLTMAATPLAAPSAAWAQSDNQVQFDVPAGDLDYVLTSIAAQARRRIVFDPAIVRGRSAQRVSGRMSPDTAIRLAIAGTDLVLRQSEQGGWLILRAPVVSQEGAKLLDTVRVNAAPAGGGAADGRYVGANGSSDPIATEGTKSYTARATTLASKTPLSLLETPQAVSILTQQQLEDRVITSFNGGLDALPGLTITRETGGGTTIRSRGFGVNNVQIDGGAPLSVGDFNNFSSNYRVLDDLSIYDSVTVQRGSAGTFNGSGGAGGAINLERKRPLDHQALSVTLQGGSWNQLRAVVDASSPSLANGLIRARAVVTAERTDYFYNDASRRFAQAFLNLEVDASPRTILNLGGKFGTVQDTPFRGLPTGPDGQLLDLPRETCFCTPWSKATTDSREVFAQLRQTIGDHLTARLNATGTWQTGTDDSLVFTPTYGRIGVTPGRANDGSFNVFRSDRRSDQYVVDGYVNGKYTLLGIDIDGTLGANYQWVNQQTLAPASYYFYSGTTALPFDSTQFRRPVDSEMSPDGGQYNPRWFQERYGAYANLRVTPVNWLNLTISERYDSVRIVNVTAYSPTDQSRSAISRTNWSPPNLGLVATLNKKFSLYANYSSIYDPQNLLTADGTFLPPMTGVNFEGGVKASLRDGKLNFSLAGFFIDTRHVAVADLDAFLPPDPNGASCCYRENSATLRSRGIETQAQGALTDRLNIDVLSLPPNCLTRPRGFG